MRTNALPIGRIATFHIGTVVTIVEKDADDRKIETSGVLSSIRRIYKEDEDTTLDRIEVRLGGNDADMRNGMLFVIDADESEDYSIIFFTTPR
jgi:hypothetical protein